MIDYIMSFELNSLLGILLYWVPLSLCVYGYTVRTWLNYQKDIQARDSERHYHPTDTIGSLIARGLVSVTPVANLWAAAFDVAPKVLGSFFRGVGRVFDMPLVGPKKAGG